MQKEIKGWLSGPWRREERPKRSVLRLLAAAQMLNQADCAKDKTSNISIESKCSSLF